MNYEMFMRAALAEAVTGRRVGERPDGAVAVLDEALVARGHEQVVGTGDPTAHAVIVVLREAARKLGSASLGGLVVFATREPCAMCVGALLESDAAGIVFSLADGRSGAAGSAIQLASGDRLPRRLSVVSGILQEAAAEVCGAPITAAQGSAPRH
jgi:tRNA(adenine34) deaminase